MINKNMSFFDHLDELRNRIIKSILFIILFSIISYYYSALIIDILINPIKNYSINFQVLKITSIFLIKIAISIMSGILISFPFILYQSLQFVLPAFNLLTIKKIYFFTIISFILFISGIIFGYRIIIPFSITFFNSLSLGIEYINLNYTLDNYLFYLIWILTISSFIFQLPFLIIIIIKVGLVDIKYLKNHRKHIIVFFFIFAAILTPPDPVSQVCVVLPLYLLFEISLLLSKIIK